MILRCSRAIASIVIAAFLSIVTGCSPTPSGGQEESAALAQIRSIDGIQDAVVDAGGSYNGFKREAGTIVTISLSPGFSVVNLSDLADFLVRLGWSVRVEEPNEELSFRVDGISSSLLASAFKDAGWTLPGEQDGYFVHVAPDVVRAKLGRWPGPVPKIPEGMIVTDENLGL